MTPKKNRVAIVGSRNWKDANVIREYIQAIKDKENTEIVSGGARGVDTIAEVYAKEFGIVTKIFPAEWDTYGKAAGFKRNTDIVAYCTSVVAFWDGKSRGTLDTLQKAIISSNVKRIEIVKE